MARHNFTGPRSALRIERMLKALAAGPMTARQLSEQLFMSYATATMYLAHLQLSPRRVRIADWQQPEVRGRNTPVYALGAASGVPEPRLTAKQKRARERAKRRADPDVKEAYLVKRRARDRRARREAGVMPRVFKDPLMQWIPKQNG